MNILNIPNVGPKNRKYKLRTKAKVRCYKLATVFDNKNATDSID